LGKYSRAQWLRTKLISVRSLDVEPLADDVVFFVCVGEVELQWREGVI
jgi:hypothetical protein